MLQLLAKEVNGHLTKLALIGAKKPAFSTTEVHDFTQELDLIIAEVRSSWTFTIISDASVACLERYFNYQAEFLFKLLKVGPGDGVGTDPFTSANVLLLYNDRINALLNVLNEYYGKYVEQSISVNPLYKLHYTKDLKVITNLLAANLEDSNLNKKVKCFLLRYIKDMTVAGESSCTWGQLQYFRSFIQLAYPILAHQENERLEDLLCEILLDLEFNQFDLFVWQQARISSALSNKIKSAKLKAIRAYINLMKFKARGDVIRYDQRWPPLSVMLLDWLKDEVKALEPIRVKELRPVAVNNFRLQLQLSVSHLGLLIRLLAKESLFGSIPLTELFEFFTSNFSTKRKDVFSSHNLSKEYYSKNQVTAAEIKDLLSKMIGRINLEYFPVVAVLSATAFYH